MASQADLQNQLKAQDAIIINIENRLARISPRASISTVNALKEELAKAKAEKARVEKQLNDLKTTQSYQANQGNANTGNTSKPSQANLEQQLIKVDTDIRNKEAEIANLEKNPRRNNQAIRKATGELQKLKNDKVNIENQLKNVAVPSAQDPRAMGVNRAEVPNVQNPSQGNSTGLQGATTRTRAQATSRQVFETDKKEDWRFRLYLAPNSTYLYNDKENKLLQPLNGVGVIFPYTPTISVSYIANYDAQAVTHSNYKLYFYKDSAVENISIVGEFTAQNTEEANYLLAVIHFFKSVTKMFYGRDQSPVIGTPPPICYLDGFGTYQFNKHPVLINNFSYSLPNDVDYIRASYPPPLISNTYTYPQRLNEKTFSPKERLIGVQQGGTSILPQFTRQASGIPTYVPTKMQITITAYPVISRRDISSNFSVKEYANGNLLLGRSNPNTIGAGMW